MGYAGDVLGRNMAMTLTLSLVVFGALCSAAISYGAPTEVYITIIIARFILGIGVGGVYPLSATKASEDGGGDGHGPTDPTAAAWAFFWQIPGSMVQNALINCAVHDIYIDMSLYYVLKDTTFVCFTGILYLHCRPHGYWHTFYRTQL